MCSTLEFIQHSGKPTLTLRQLDEWHQVTKGTAFRYFKAALPQMREGQDFFRIDGMENPDYLRILRTQDKIYPSSIHLILVTASGYDCFFRSTKPPEQFQRGTPFQTT